MESLDQFRSLEVREKVRNVFVMSLGLCDHKVLQNIASFVIEFFRFHSDLLSFFARISYFLNFRSLRNLIKHDMRLVIANSTLRASLAINEYNEVCTEYNEVNTIYNDFQSNAPYRGRPTNFHI